MPQGTKVVEEAAFKSDPDAWSTTLKKVVLPDGLTHIGDDAFAKNYSLETVVVPASVQSIGTDAFSDSEVPVTLTVEQGSYAEEYAIKNGITFRYAKKKGS